MAVVSEIASLLAANSLRTASRLEMYSTTDYREGRVVVLPKDFPDTGCRFEFVRGWTSCGGPNRRSDRYVGNRGCAVSAPIVVMALGNGVSFQEDFCFG